MQMGAIAVGVVAQWPAGHPATEIIAKALRVLCGGKAASRERHTTRRGACRACPGHAILLVVAERLVIGTAGSWVLRIEGLVSVLVIYPLIYLSVTAPQKPVPRAPSSVLAPHSWGHRPYDSCVDLNAIFSIVSIPYLDLITFYLWRIYENISSLRLPENLTLV